MRKMRKALAIILLSIMCVLPAMAGELIEQSVEDGPALVGESSNQCGDNVYWALSDGVLTISGTGEMYDYNYNAFAPWHSQVDKIKSIIIESGVTSIGDYAFSSSDSLTSITLPDSITSIGYAAFGGCVRLTSVAIPDSVTSMGEEAFQGCNVLTSVTIGDGVTSIGDYAFSGCSDLKSIYFEGNSLQFGVEVFYGVTATAYYPAFNSTWSDDVRQDYSGNITWIPIGEASGQCGDNVYWTLSAEGMLTIFGTGDMWDYTDSKNVPWRDKRDYIIDVVIEDGITKIGDNSFSGCQDILNLSIPDTVLIIGDGAFATCANLPGVKLPDSVQEIGDDAFCETALESIVIPNSVKSLGDTVFLFCNNLKSVTIGEGVKSIGTSAFDSCYSLSSIYFEGDSPEFGMDVFGFITATAYYPAGNPTWTEGVRQNYGGNITWVPYDPSGVELYEDTLKLPESTTTIESESFAGLTQGVNIDIPGTVTHIDDDAFEGSAVVIIGEAGGYVEEFCNEHEIPFSAR